MDEKQPSGSPDYVKAPRTIDDVNAEYGKLAGALGDALCKSTHHQQVAQALQEELLKLVKEGNALMAAAQAKAAGPTLVPDAVLPPEATA